MKYFLTNFSQIQKINLENPDDLCYKYREIYPIFRPKELESVSNIQKMLFTKNWMDSIESY